MSEALEVLAGVSCVDCKNKVQCISLKKELSLCNGFEQKSRHAELLDRINRATEAMRKNTKRGSSIDSMIVNPDAAKLLEKFI